MGLSSLLSATSFLSLYELFNLSSVAVNISGLIARYVYSGKGIKLKRVEGLYFEVLLSRFFHY